MTTRKTTRESAKATSSRTANRGTPARARKAAKASTPKPKPKAEPRRAADGKGKNGDAEKWTLRLYITGRGERSERALRNLRNLCEANMKEGTYKIEVIDLLKNPALAKADQILAIPTLVRKLPEPMKRIIGDLSDADRALLSLDLPKLH